MKVTCVRSVGTIFITAFFVFLAQTGLAHAGTDSELYVYKGEEISAEEASPFVCSMGNGVNVWYDSIFDAEAADGNDSLAAKLVDSPPFEKAAFMELFQSGGESDHSAKGPGSGGIGPGKFCRSTSISDNLYEFNYPDLDFAHESFYLGPAFIKGMWQTYNSTNIKTTTSFSVGMVGAKFNLHADGSGVKYPYTTPKCNVTPSLRGTPWNNRFRSRKRLSQ